MTNEDALKMVERYNYWHGGEDATGNIWTVESYLYDKEHYQEAKEQIENSVKAIEILKTKLPFYITEIQGYKYLAIKQGDIRRSDVLITITNEEYEILKELLKNSMEV